jgi:hypothetical protein
VALPIPVVLLPSTSQDTLLAARAKLKTDGSQAVQHEGGGQQGAAGQQAQRRQNQQVAKNDGNRKLGGSFECAYRTYGNRWLDESESAL